ncbi:uncharacterized protein LOC132945656 [Metopolophium dirhodum]|uniref:uncharacterized protein LOC132945656 n=1 Tax=Metopolophium dirhodum TaxID=44670 RepID=UPI00298FB019|nr:uncharacterized protein LOC132945656 [Metopolophium dirhodum]
MDNKRKRTSDDDGDHVQKKSKQPIVTEGINGTSSSEMTDYEIMSLMMPNGLPANRTENPEQNPRVHRVCTGQSVQGEFSGNRTEIMVWDSNDAAIVHNSDNETAPTTTVNIISSDDEMNDGDTTCFENPMGSIESTSISQQQQQFFTHPVFYNHNLNVIDLTSEDDVIYSDYSIENYEDIDENLLELQQHQIITHPVFYNHNLDIIDFTSENDVINSHYAIENDENIDENLLELQQHQIFTHPIFYNHNLDVIDFTSENYVINSHYANENDEDIDENLLELQQQQIFTHPVFDNHNLDVIDFTSENDVINSHYAIENDEDIDENLLELQQHQIFAHPVIDNRNMVVIELSSEDDIDIFINSYHSIENDETRLETCFENPMDLQQQIFGHPVLYNQYDSLDVIELSSEDDIYINFVINSNNSIENDEEMINETQLETIPEESVNSIPLRISIDEQQQLTLLDSNNLNVIDLTSEDDDINSHYSVQNYQDIDETRLETIPEESVNSIPLRISIDEQQQLTLLDSNNLNVIDLTSEDDDDTNL